MPTVRERKSSKNDNEGNITCDGDDAAMEVIEVSDNEVNDNDKTEIPEVDLTESADNQDACETTNQLPESSEKENSEEDEEKEEGTATGEKRIGLLLPKPDKRRTRSDVDCDDHVEERDEDADSNSEEEPGIAVTRSKRNSVRRPTRPGDLEFDYGDSTDFDEEEDVDRSRPTRALLERQRNSRAAAVAAEELGDGDSGRRSDSWPETRRSASGRGAAMPPSAGRKRSSVAAEGQASQKRRRRNQTTVEELEEVDGTDDGPATRSHSNNNSNSSHSNSSSNNNNNNGCNDSRTGADSKGSAPSNGNDDSDLFCWVCHRYGKVICCETCVRVYHMRCLNLSSEPSDDWFCPECADSLLDAQPTLNLLNDEVRKPIISQEELVPLLLQATKKMFEVPSSEPFHQPVDTSDVRDYDTYIVNPMSLSTLQENVKAKKYGSVGSFMSDARWIVHNCIVYNGHANPLTTVSRQILKRCRLEVREINACPDCYRYQSEAEDGKTSEDGIPWFSKLCRIPHPIVWVRLKNYPEWPAKVIEEVRRRDGPWVRTKFFGAHDYADVPYSCATFHTPIRAAVDPKTLQVEHFKEALDELQTHQRLLKEKYPDFSFPSVPVNFVPEIADNIYRRLGCRQTRVVCATIGATGPSSGASSDAGPPGETAATAVPGSGHAGQLSSRRSSSESVSSSVFASGTNVHMYRAKPISDTKTRLVSVAMTTSASDGAPASVPPVEDKGASAGDEKAEAASLNGTATPGEASAAAATVGSSGELSSSGEPADASLMIQNDGAISGTKVPGGRSRRARVHSGDSTQEESGHQTDAADGELEEQPEQQEAEPDPERMELEAVEEVEEVDEVEELEEVVEVEDAKEEEEEAEEVVVEEEEEEEERKDEKEPPQLRPHPCSLEKATSTEDVDDIFASLRSSSSVDSMLRLPLIDLLNGLRWGGRPSSPTRSRASPSSAAGTAPGPGIGSGEPDNVNEALARKEAECLRLSRENAQLRKAMTALESLKDEGNTKFERELSLSEERQALMHELKLLEVRHNYELCLAEARHAHENDKVKIVTEVRRLLTEDVKKIVAEVKRKQWCAYCRNEAFYYCCWNTSYCDANCQKKHWTTHMSTCAQTNPSLTDGVARRGAAASQANNLGTGGSGGLAPQILAGRRMLNPNNMAQLPQR